MNRALQFFCVGIHAKMKKAPVAGLDASKLDRVSLCETGRRKKADIRTTEHFSFYTRKSEVFGIRNVETPI